MIKTKFLMAVLALATLMPMKSLAQSDFFFGLESSGSNAWFMFPQVPVLFINELLGGGTGSTGIEWTRISDSQGKLKMDNGNYFGIKAKDLFNQFGYGLTFGYQPKFSMLGVFAHGGYNFRQFRMQPDRNLDGMEKYKLNSYSAGIGVRFTPLISNLEYNGWSPVLELGTDYHKVFSCTAPFEDDADQMGSGFTTHLAVGARFYDDYSEKGITVSIAVELPHYDYFNKDFTAPTGAKPYADIDSKNYSISLRIQQDI